MCLASHDVGPRLLEGRLDHPLVILGYRRQRVTGGPRRRTPVVFPHLFLRRVEGDVLASAAVREAGVSKTPDRKKGPRSFIGLAAEERVRVGAADTRATAEKGRCPPCAARRPSSRTARASCPGEEGCRNAVISHRGGECDRNANLGGATVCAFKRNDRSLVAARRRIAVELAHEPDIVVNVSGLQRGVRLQRPT